MCKPVHRLQDTVEHIQLEVVVLEALLGLVEVAVVVG